MTHCSASLEQGATLLTLWWLQKGAPLLRMAQRHVAVFTQSNPKPFWAAEPSCVELPAGEAFFAGAKEHLRDQPGGPDRGLSQEAWPCAQGERGLPPPCGIGVGVFLGGGSEVELAGPF